MKEQLITFKTAKLAKEKGLNFSSDNIVYNDSGRKCVVDYDTSVITEDIPCVSQSILQKWLREIHNIHVWLEPLGFKMEYDVYVNHADDWKKGEENTCVGEDFNTYEEALEKGLQEALTLINVKIF